MHRINVILDDNAWKTLQEIPRGERSKMVSKAIVKMADLERKIKAAKLMDSLRMRTPKTYTSAQVSAWVREDRKR